MWRLGLDSVWMPPPTHRYKPADFLSGARSIDQQTLVARYCTALAGACGTESYSFASGAVYSNAARHAEMVAKAARAIAAHDVDGDGSLTEAELAMAVRPAAERAHLASACSCCPMPLISTPGESVRWRR